MAILTLAFAACVIFARRTDGLWFFVVLCLLWGVIALLTIWRNINWMYWKKQFVQVSHMLSEQEDSPVTVELSEQGCTLCLPDKTAKLFCWKDVEDARCWREGWDILSKMYCTGISLRRADLMVGTAQALEDFLRRKTKQPLRPRDIELDELKRIYKIEE